MSRIFWDSNLFIYLLEDHPEFSQAVADLRRKMLERGDQLLTSALTLGEVLVKPLALDDLDLSRTYEQMLASAAWFCLSMARRREDMPRFGMIVPSKRQMPYSSLVQARLARISSLLTIAGSRAKEWKEFSSSLPWTKYRSDQKLTRQLLQNIFPQFLRLAEEFLIFDE